MSSDRVDEIDTLDIYVDMSDSNRHVAFDPEIPYNGLPLIPRSGLETTSALKASIEARDAVARLRAVTMALPNPAIVINAIPLLEARDSSRIENIVTTTDQLFRHAGGGYVSDDPATKEALRYRSALLAGFDSIRRRPVTTRTAVEIAAALLGIDAEIRRVPGTVLKNAATGETVYSPPVGEDVLRDKLADWEAFVHDRDVDALIRMAVGHYQFEAIHPFTDGNGRTGRILNTLLVVEEGLLDQPLLYLSRYVLKHRDEYYARLRAVTVEGAWQEWIAFMLEGVRETATWTAAMVEQVVVLMHATDAHIKRVAPTVHSHELVEVLFTYPYSRITNIVEAGVAQRQTASTYLQRLAELGIVNEVKSGREKLFINQRLLDVLSGEELVIPGEWLLR